MIGLIWSTELRLKYSTLNSVASYCMLKHQVHSFDSSLRNWSHFISFRVPCRNFRDCKSDHVIWSWCKSFTMIKIWDSENPGHIAQVNMWWIMTSNNQGQSTYQCILCGGQSHSRQYWSLIAVFRVKGYLVSPVYRAKVARSSLEEVNTTGHLLNVFHGL